MNWLIFLDLISIFFLATLVFSLVSIGRSFEVMREEVDKLRAEVDEIHNKAGQARRLAGEATDAVRAVAKTQSMHGSWLAEVIVRQREQREQQRGKLE